VVAVLRVEGTSHCTSWVSNQVPTSKYIGCTDTPGRRRGGRSLSTLHNCRRTFLSVAATMQTYRPLHSHVSSTFRCQATRARRGLSWASCNTASELNVFTAQLLTSAKHSVWRCGTLHCSKTSHLSSNRDIKFHWIFS
jgi:hypothetical protein